MGAKFAAVHGLGDLFGGWRGLGRFWAGLLLALLIASGALQVLGPRPGRVMPEEKRSSRADAVAGDPESVEHRPAAGDPHRAPAEPGVRPAKQSAIHAGRPGRDSPGPTDDPDASLLERYPGEANAGLPKIASDGRAPMAVYAAGFDPSGVRPRVGMLIAGIGMVEADSLAAIKQLPGGVTLAITPYAGDIGHLLEAVRMAEHEYLLSIPMEPAAYPVNDPDDRHALMTSLPPSENLDRLRWILSRISGYVGVTNALGEMRGERLAGVSDQLASVLTEVADRGLLFVDARAGQQQLPQTWNCSVDIAIDDGPMDAAALDQRLDLLTHTALDKGSALGIVRTPRPVTLARVAAWTNTLAAKGLALAPVSALVRPPAKQEAAK